MLMFPGQQFLSQFIGTPIRILSSAGKMMNDAHPGGTAGVIGERQDFVNRLPAIDLVLRERTSGANCEQLRGDADKSGEQQLFALKFRSKPRHGVKQTASQSPACSCRSEE